MNRIKTILIILLFLTQINISYSANVTEDTTFSTDATAQQIVTEDDVDIIISTQELMSFSGNFVYKFAF